MLITIIKMTLSTKSNDTLPIPRIYLLIILSIMIFILLLTVIGILIL